MSHLAHVPLNGRQSLQFLTAGLQLEHHPMPFCPDLGPCSVNKAHEPDAGPCLLVHKPWTFPQPSQPAKDILFLAPR